MPEFTNSHMRILFPLFILFFSFSIFGQDNPSTPIRLSPMIEREIKLKESHRYSFSLNDGEFVRFEIEQKNVDPLLTISDANNNRLHQLYFEKIAGKSAISFVADKKGEYLLTVESSGRSRIDGSYRLSMTNPRATEESDRQRIDAEKILTGDALDIIKAKTVIKNVPLEQRKERLASLQKLLEVWQRLNDPIFEQETWHQIGTVANKLNNSELRKIAFEKVLELAKSNKDVLDEAWALYHLGDLAENRGDIETARKNFLAANHLVVKSGARLVEAEMLNRLANFHQHRAQFDKAQELFEKTIAIYQQLKSEVDEARSKLSLTVILSETDPQHDLTKAYEEVLIVFEKNDAFYEKAKVLRILGSTLADKSQFADAEKYFTESLSLMEKLGEPQDEAFALLGLGLLKFTQSKLGEAIQSLNQALSKLSNKPDSIVKIRVLMGLARVDFYQGKLTEGLGKLKEASDVADRIKVVREQIQVNSLLSTVYLSLGKNEEALQAALAAKKISDAANSKSDQAVAVNALGRVYHLQGNYTQAIKLFEETIKFAEEANQPRVKALGYQTLGAVYNELNDFRRAEINTLKAIEILQKQRGSLDILLSNLLLAQIYLRQNRIPEAKAKLDNILETIKITKNRLIEAQVNQLLGNIALREKDFNQASQKFTEALTLHSRNKAVIGIALALKGLGDSFAGIGNFSQAQTIYGQTLGVFRQIGSPTGEAAIFESLMNLENKKGNPKLAVFYGKQSVGLSQLVRGSIKTLEAEIRKSFLTSVETSYRELASILIEENRLSEAQQIIALLKEEEFYQFTQRSPDSVSGFENKVELTVQENEAAQKYKILVDKISITTARVTELELIKRGRKPTDDEQAELQKLQAELVALNSGFVKYLQDISGSFSASSESKLNDTPLQTRQWQKRLADIGPESVLLTTLITEDKYYVIATTPTSQFSRKFEIKNSDLLKKINKLHELLEVPHTDFLSNSQELYQILVKPLEPELLKLKAKTLLWSLDSALRYIPFAALHDGEKYLVEKYTNVLITLAQSPQNSQTPIASWKALGAGVSIGIKGFEPLIYVPSELKNIVRDETSKNFKTEKGLFIGKRLLNEDFTRQNLGSYLSRKFQIVHLATHFNFNPGKDIDSFLLLGDGSRLSLAEMRSDKTFDLIGVDLLTLSACETGLNSTDANGSEIESFGVIAQRRGAKAVIVSLWSISDKATSQLMIEFYRIYKYGNGRVSKAEALRRAQITILKNNKINRNYSHPAYWASFVVVGEWR